MAPSLTIKLNAAHAIVIAKRARALRPLVSLALQVKYSVQATAVCQDAQKGTTTITVSVPLATALALRAMEDLVPLARNARVPAMRTDWALASKLALMECSRDPTTLAKAVLQAVRLATLRAFATLARVDYS